MRNRKRILIAAVVVVAAVGVGAVVHWLDTRKPVAPPGGRVIHFPDDRSMGTVLLYDSDRERAGDRIDARGGVIVSPGHEVTLWALFSDMSLVETWLYRFGLWEPEFPNPDLSPLSRLRPGDLDVIYFFNYPIPDEEFDHVAGFGFQVSGFGLPGSSFSFPGRRKRPAGFTPVCVRRDQP